MPQNTVETKFLSDSRSAQADLARMEKRMRAIEGRLASQNRLSKKGARSFGEMTGSFLKSHLGLAALAASATTFARHMVEARKETERTALSIEKSVKAYRIQAGLSALQTKEAKSRFAAISKATGVKQEQVGRIATEAASQGFADPLKKNGVVEAVIATLQSTNQDVESADLEGLVGAFGKYLVSAGRQKNGANLLDIAMRTRGLFKETPLQLAMLPDYAKARSVGQKANVSDQTFLSAAAILSETTDSAEGSTGLRNTILRMSSPEPEAIKRMQKAGLDPTAIDLVGETLPEALKRLGAVIDKLPEADRLPFVKDIFGQKVAVPALNLIQGAQAGKFEAFDKLQGDRAGFVEGVRVARGGTSGAIARAKAERQALAGQLGDHGAITEAEYAEQRNIMRDREILAIRQVHGKGTVADMLEGGVRFFRGIESKSAEYFGGFMASTPEQEQEIRARRKVDTEKLQKQIDQLDEQIRQQERIEKQLAVIAGNTAPQKVPNRKRQGE